jgi:hypothetical protein
MKIRSGFVSNSSSSSFVVIGTDDEKICKAIWEAHRKVVVADEGDYYGSYKHDGLDCFTTDGGLWLVGVTVTKNRDDGISIPLDEFVKNASKRKIEFVKKLSKYGIKINPKKIKLIASESTNQG